MPEIGREFFSDGVAADVVIAGNFDLIGLEQRDARRKEEKVACRNRPASGQQRGAGPGRDKHAAIRRASFAGRTCLRRISTGFWRRR